MAVAQSAARTPSESPNLHVVNHPLIATNLSVLRAKTTTPEEFRRNLNELSVLLAVEASKHWPTKGINIETPLATCASARLAKPIVLVPILRAGLGMADGILQIMPQASVGHLGIYRDEKTLRPVSYYSRLPENVSAAHVVLLDPMLATGFSACEAVSILKKHGAQQIQFLCVISCDAGIAQLDREHRDVEIITAAIDPELNNVGYIVPGLGDAGDRYFGTE
jgi:uracil phosphoribosyltransferase